MTEGEADAERDLPAPDATMEDLRASEGRTRGGGSTGAGVTDDAIKGLGCFLVDMGTAGRLVGVLT